MRENEIEQYIEKQPNGCWLWKGKRGKNKGYGSFRLNGKIIRIHVYMYEKKFDKIQLPYPFNVLDHLICNIPACCNPDHLNLTCVGKNGSRHHTEKTHCPQGHAYTEDNIVYYRTWRRCKKCMNDRYHSKYKFIRL